MQLLVGLGNPGPRYEGTRHNAGFEVVRAVAARAGAAWRDDGPLRARSAALRVGDDEALLLLPQD